MCLSINDYHSLLERLILSAAKLLLNLIAQRISLACHPVRSVSSGLVAGAVSSPPSCPAPFVCEVRRLAVAAGASWLCLRPSARSFSRWCVVVFFSSRAAASGFAAPVGGFLPGDSFYGGFYSFVVRGFVAWCFLLCGGFFRCPAPLWCLVVRFCPCVGAFPCGACFSLSLFVCSCWLVSVGGSSAFFYSDRPLSE